MQPSEQAPKPLMPFPSPPLIVLSVASCFLASAALVSAFTQVNTHFAYFIVPSTIGFIATVPYHVHMYISARAHRRNPSTTDPIFISNDWVLYNFLLITLWTVIFIINILFCVGEGTAGVVMTTIWSGFEWNILLLLAIITIAQIRRSNLSNPDNFEAQPESARAGCKNLVYFISYTLCTLTLVIGIDIHIPVLFNVIAFFLTAPHHIALFIVYARHNSSFKFFSILSRQTNVAYAFFLSTMWCGTVILGILTSRFLYQSILIGIFGGLECVIIAYLAVRSVLDVFAEGQIKL